MVFERAGSKRQLSARFSMEFPAHKKFSIESPHSKQNFFFVNLSDDLIIIINWLLTFWKKKSPIDRSFYLNHDIDIFIHFLIILILIIEEDQIEKFHIIIYRINQKPKYVTFWRIFFKKYHTPEIYHNISHGLTSDLKMKTNKQKGSPALSALLCAVLALREIF